MYKNINIHSDEVLRRGMQSFLEYIAKIGRQHGEELLKISGISESQLDIVSFSKDFFNNSGAVADISVDPNANVKEKTVDQFSTEISKAHQNINAYFYLYKQIMKAEGSERAKRIIEKLITGEIFVNDFWTYPTRPYCYAFSLQPLLYEGVSFAVGMFDVKPAQHPDSYINIVIQMVAYISNQIAGAVALPTFLIDLDYFLRKEFGEKYRDRWDADASIFSSGNAQDSTLGKWVKNRLQNFVFSVNWPFRNAQSLAPREKITFYFPRNTIRRRSTAKEIYEEYRNRNKIVIVK